MKVLLYSDWFLASDYLDPIERVIRAKHPDWVVDKGGNGVPVEDTYFDWVVSCDELSAAPRGGRNLCVFHGLASKGQAFSTARRDAFVSTDTIFAVPGDYYANILIDMGVPPQRVHVTGLTKLDGFKPNILFAPTHNPELSAIPVVTDRIYELGNVRVRLHMWTMQGKMPNQPVYRSYYHDYSGNGATEDLQWADVVIGDFGSIIVEAIALGKRAIQVVNPQWLRWHKKQGLTEREVVELPEVVFTERYATRCHSFEELRDAVNIIQLGNSAGRVVTLMERTR